MRLLVCGGVDFTDVEYSIPRIHRVHLKTPVTTLICGMARGGDSIANAWAKHLNIPVEEYAITQDDWKRHGNAAGPIRNQRMLDQGKPDKVLGLPGRNGTAHMLAIARAVGIVPIEYRYRYFSRARDPVDGFMSNFYKHDQYDEDGLVYPTNEHYYQCEKTIDPEKRHWIYTSPDPATSKQRGNSRDVLIRPDWDDKSAPYKIEAMTKGLRMKFPIVSELSDRLLNTGDDYLVELAPWGNHPDRYWGVDKDKRGLNWLGRLLMRRRDEIIIGRTK